MPSFLIQSPHSIDDCVKAIQYTHSAGFLTHFHWGCKSGDHTGYAILDATDKAEAMMVIPPMGRPTARIIELTQFTPAEIKAMHDKR